MKKNKNAEINKSVSSSGKNKSNVTRDKAYKKFQYEFISATSHQLRTPIASIQSSLEVLELYMEKKNTARQFQVLHKIKKSFAGLNEILEHITTLYKSELKKPQLNVAKIDPRKFFNDILDEIMVASSNACFINTNFDLPQKFIYADEFVLKQIIVNLVGNALKFSPEGGQVRITLRSNKNKLEISVKDEGIGISEKDIKKLYRPFFRGANTAGIKGDGLGLAIVKKLCALHKGKIKCSSVLNEGTEFIVEIPMKFNE